jgi:hypothetical protein
MRHDEAAAFWESRGNPGRASQARAKAQTEREGADTERIRGERHRQREAEVTS